MDSRKLTDDEVRCLRKIFVTWLKKEGYYEDYINAKMFLNKHPYTPAYLKVSDGWPYNLNESKIFNDYCSYSNIIDRTIDYYRCRGIRSDWERINDKWKDFALGNEALLMSCFLKTK